MPPRRLPYRAPPDELTPGMHILHLFVTYFLACVATFVAGVFLMSLGFVEWVGAENVANASGEEVAIVGGWTLFGIIVLSMGFAAYFALYWVLHVAGMLCWYFATRSLRLVIVDIAVSAAMAVGLVFVAWESTFDVDLAVAAALIGAGIGWRTSVLARRRVITIKRLKERRDMVGY